MSSASIATTDPAQFIDQSGIDWQRVKRTRYFCYQRFCYEYPGPIQHLRQTLVVVPSDRYGDQSLCDYRLTVSPYPATSAQVADCFGNRIFKLEVRWIRDSIAFEIRTLVERISGLNAAPHVASAKASYFLRPTELTASDERIVDVARELAARAKNSYDLAEQISDWVGVTLQYGSGATSVSTTAPQVLQIGKGLCQDYAHLMLAICRAAGLPCRYVSGHMLGEGGSHAWVEVLIPSERTGGLHAFALDPTNRRRPNLGYTVVATGRDYRDVPPTSGSFTAPYGGRLQFTKRAGLTLLELTDGEVIDSE